MSTVKAAVAQYDIGFFSQWSEFENKLASWVGQAAEQGAGLLVFPEYGSMELASLFGEPVYKDLARQLHAMQEIYGDYEALYAQLARQFDVMILASSFPVQQQDGSFRNSATL